LGSSCSWRRARPEQPLGARALGFERREARRAELLLVDQVGELGVGDGGLALQGLAGRAHAFQLLVDERVHAADEEAGHGGDVPDVVARLHAPLQAAQIGFDDLRVALLREEKRDVDRDAVGGDVLERLDALFGSGDLDHEVVSADERVQARGLRAAGFGVAGHGGRQFEAHVAVGALGVRVNALEQVAGRADVLGGQAPEDISGGFALGGELADGLVVVDRGADRLLEDRRVGGDAGQAVLVDEAFELPRGDQPAADVVVPDADAEAL
jgi:hypothetical protein